MEEAKCPQHGRLLAERLNNNRTRIVRYCPYCEAEQKFESYARDIEEYHRRELRGRLISSGIASFVFSYGWGWIIVGAICGGECTVQDISYITLILSGVVVTLSLAYVSNSCKFEKPSVHHLVEKEELKAKEYKEEVDRFLESHREQWREVASGIEDLDRMTGTRFERFMARFFERIGYRVNVTPKVGDKGADLILSKENKKIAVQCKRYSPRQSVGVKAVQEVFSAKALYDCDEAWIVTTSYFTDPAVDMAQKLGVVLWDREDLIEELAKVQQRIPWEEYKRSLYE